MMCVFGDGEAGVVRQSDKGTMIGLCPKHSYLTLKQLNYLLYRKAERSFCKMLIWGI